MAFLRSLVFNICFFGWTSLLAIISIPAVFMGKRAVFAILIFWLKSVFFFEKYILGLTYTVKGIENLPPKPYIVAAKHQSAWETMKLHLIFDDPAVVLKQSLMDLPFWGRYAKVMGMIPVERSKGSEALKKMIAHAKTVREEGRPIVIFPQGTRVAVGDQKNYKIGVIRLYEELNIPLVPVALNSGVFWKRNSFTKKPGEITVEILPSIAPGKDGQSLLSQLETDIEKASNHLAKKALTDES